jgi:hypothetical protein
MDQVEPFPDNWTYLRTELNWLDRVLATAVARQRKDVKDVDRIARSPADRVTSHWWKGLITLEGEMAGDSPADSPRRGSGNRLSYPQQMEARIQASQEKAIHLGLPALSQRLQLSNFEKNLVLLALAPEVSRRYSRIYHYLQESEPPQPNGLPTVDLILRLLCRNDAEWRTARLSLTAESTLVQHSIFRLPDTAQNAPFLAYPVKLSDPVVEFLLADRPLPDALESCLKPPESNFSSVALRQSGGLNTWLPPTRKGLPDSEAVCPADPWSALVLPEPLIASLRHLSDRVRYAQQIDAPWGVQSETQLTQGAPSGTVTLLVGAPGTGKTSAARAIAHRLEMPLVWLDLACIVPTEMAPFLQTLAAQQPTVLLIKSAQVWLGQSPSVPVAAIRNFLDQRRHLPVLTLLSVGRRNLMKASWREQMDYLLEFPMPDASSRLRLWQQAFPAAVPLAPELDWSALTALPLSGGEIQAIARDAAIFAAAEGSSTPLTLHHLIQACNLRNRKLRIPPISGE